MNAKECLHCIMYRLQYTAIPCNHLDFPAKCTVCYYRLKKGLPLYKNERYNGRFEGLDEIR